MDKIKANEEIVRRELNTRKWVEHRIEKAEKKGRFKRDLRVLVLIVMYHVIIRIIGG